LNRTKNDSIQKGSFNTGMANHLLISEREDDNSIKGTGISRSSVRAEGGVSEDLKNDI
jgi:hypothetical protein